MYGELHTVILDLTGKKALAIADAIIGEVRDAYAFVPLIDGRQDLS